MSHTLPPWAATWLLERFTTGPMRHALAGDLMEQYGVGRSAWWFWRQVLGAVVMSGWTELGAHKLLAIRAGVIAYVTFAVVSSASVLLIGGGPLSGWTFSGVVGAWHLATGWTTVRLHRQSYAGTALLVVSLVVLWNLSDLGRMTVNALAHPRYQPYLFAHVAQTALAIVSTLIGALLCSPDRSMSDRRPAHH